MPATPRHRATWLKDEEDDLMSFMSTISSQAGDNGNFKQPSFQKAVQHLEAIWKSLPEDVDPPRTAKDLNSHTVTDQPKMGPRTKIGTATTE
ncbi:hypothetical protein CVT24_007171 [Panaeolus cyanescens]|uniref:Uncharacterized protein n=1 Tax=Panaeolus cyanescens TaxID=181874 RepID=A0A409YPJ9_9AGAR|nr:hypothetical protein CVT24_007171 [Panaeolus cyanescens]